MRPMPALLALALSACTLPASEETVPGPTPSTLPPTTTASPRPPGSTVPVTSVADGDSMRVLFKGREQRVRLIGVDAPEVPNFGKPGECFGKPARRFARERLLGRSVRLEFDQDRRDSFGRLLAYVHVEGTMFNRVLVKQGFAVAKAYPPNVRHQGALLAAEAEARAAGRGLWQRCR